MNSIYLRIALLILTLGFSTTVFSLSWRRRSAPGAASLIAFALALALWGVSEALVWIGGPALRPLWLALTQLGATAGCTALLTFTLEYTDRIHWLDWPKAALLGIEPALTQIFFWTGWHGLFLAGSRAETVAGTAFSGAWVWVHAAYSLGLLLVAITLLSGSIAHSPLPYRLQSGALLAGELVPVVTGMVSLFLRVSFPGSDLNLLAFVLTGAAFTFALLRCHLLDIVPVTRNTVIERMSDGWMVLDRQDRIIDLNPAVEAFIGLPRARIIGQYADNYLSDFSNLRRTGDVREREIKGSVNTRTGWRYLNIRLSPLPGRNGQQIGQVIVWRDVTERRKAEEARQHARDEMFTLLHAISGAASRALNLEEFLEESIYQIVYSFQSQASVIFLLEAGEDRSSPRKLRMAAHHGLPAGSVQGMGFVPEAYEMVSWVLQHREPLLIPDISTDPRVPWSMQQQGHLSLLIAPMLIEEQLLGVIGLGRREGPVYTTDEIARVSAVGEEVATFIHSNRQRQMAIALTERQRLVRDLHDSVTQKLYGLVTLTEAAQAGLEAGSAEVSAQVLGRIGENARQALKEMRLFLHELQPVDLEREGLVSVLHQRLAAVEGRADVKARLLADDDLVLPLDIQVALYYIAQEALNNVLKHAGASSVTVRLRKRNTGFLLEVEDDGCGFNPQKSDKGGMGLRNMQERASQVGGKLKVASTPGKGTKISVVVKQNKLSKTQSRGHSI
ncbi:MAG: histidine kinase N-terminal 7TM domain-containing protein [Anaerolineales bacterium]